MPAEIGPQALAIYGSLRGSIRTRIALEVSEEVETRTGVIALGEYELPSLNAGDVPDAHTLRKTVSRTLRAWTLLSEVSVPDSSAVVNGNRIRNSEITDQTYRSGRKLAVYAGVSEQVKPMPVSRIDSAATDYHTNR